MVRTRGPRLTPAQKTDVWRRWRQGESLSAIGRALGRIPRAVYHVVAGAGGMPPPPRQRSRRALTLAEREEVSRGLAHGYSLRAIGRGLGRVPSTVSREVRRHGGRHRYRAADADRRAWKRSRRPKRCRLATSPALRDVVATQLACEWSPQQIAGPEVHRALKPERSQFVQPEEPIPHFVRSWLPALSSGVARLAPRLAGFQPEEPNPLA